METAKIRKGEESAGIGKHDRISNLPDDILRHILSFLPTLDSVRTTVLSKTWNKNKLWISVPTVELDIRNYHSSTDRFIMFVDHVFSCRGASDIRKFRLRLELERKKWSQVENWICTAIRCNVVELDLTLICFFKQVYFRMPQSVFTNKTLLVLKVLSNCITYSSSSTLGAENLFSNSIEDLTIIGYRWNVSYDPINFNITAPRMKKLKIAARSCHIFIDAPKLEICNVLLSERAGAISFVESPKSLQHAKVTPGVKYLILSVLHAEPCFSNGFDKLNKLKMEMNLDNQSSFKWQTELLNKAPNLECLIIGFRCPKLSYSKCSFVTPESVPTCLSTKLKDIVIMARDVCNPELGDVMSLVKYFLKHGQVLKKMTVSSSTYGLCFARTKKQVSSFEKSSKICELEIMSS